MDSQTTRQRILKLPEATRTWLGSEEVVALLDTINKHFSLDKDYENVIPRLLLRLAIHDLQPDYFAGELARELDIERGKALAIATEVRRTVLGPAKKSLADSGIDIYLIDQFKMPILPKSVALGEANVSSLPHISQMATLPTNPASPAISKTPAPPAVVPLPKSPTPLDAARSKPQAPDTPRSFSPSSTLPEAPPQLSKASVPPTVKSFPPTPAPYKTPYKPPLPTAPRPPAPTSPPVPRPSSALYERPRSVAPPFNVAPSTVLGANQGKPPVPPAPKPPTPASFDRTQGKLTVPLPGSSEPPPAMLHVEPRTQAVKSNSNLGMNLGMSKLPDASGTDQKQPLRPAEREFGLPKTVNYAELKPPVPPAPKPPTTPSQK